MTRAAIYARYSSDNQRDASIEDQVRVCRALLAREGWTCAEVYADHGISGATTLRPGYQAMLADARAGRFTTVVAESLDRLSRDQEDVAALYKHLSFADMALVTVSEGTISELHVGLKGTMNALYLKDLAQKTRRGLEGRVRAGKSGGGNAYGYEVVRTLTATGEPVRGERRIDEGEATIIRGIFTDYAAGRSPKAIALRLNRDGVPGPTGHDWGPSTINGNRARGTGILNNELYVGRLVWNRLRYVKDPRTGKRISRLNPPDQWVIEDVPDLRIVPQELWDSVKARQDGLRPERSVAPDPDRPFWDRRRPRYLFSGLMRCGSCGGGYSKISANLFGCSTARNKGTCDNRLNIRRDTLEASVLHGLRDHLMDPDAFEAFMAGFLEEANRLRMHAGAERAAKERELARIERRLKAIVDAIADGMPARTLKEELLALEDRQDVLRAEIDAGESEAEAPLLHPNLARIYREKVARLQATLSEEGTRDEAFALIRSLVEEITLTPEGGELRIDLKGDLGGILTLCAQSNKARRNVATGLEQVKVVAGAGFVQERTGSEVARVV